MASSRWSQLAKRARGSVRDAASRRGLEITRNSYAKRLGRLMRLLDVDVVLDIGANTGQYGRYLRQIGYDGRILSLEPLSGAFAALQRNAAADASWDVVRAAVSDRPGTLSMNISGNSVSSSTLPMLDAHSCVDPESVYVGSEEVPSLTIDDLVRDHGVDPERSFLKIDVQGYEGVALDGAAQSLPRFRGAALELSLLPLYAGQSLMPANVARMDALGYDLWLVEPGFWDPATSRTLQCDGVFVRRGLLA